MARVVSFINYKGGVGKTTLAVELGVAISDNWDRKVLLIDADPQTNASFYLMDEDVWKKFADSGKTIKAIFDAALEGREIDIESLIIKDGLKVHRYVEKFHLIPSHLDLLEIDLILASKFGYNSLDARTILLRNIRKIENKYDYILIDCPPNMYLITQNAIVASNSIIIVTVPEYLSTIGIGLIHRIIDRINDEISSSINVFGGSYVKPEIRGIIFNKVRRGREGILSDQKQNIWSIEKLYSQIVFDTHISYTIKFPERTQEKIPICLKSSIEFKAYKDEIYECADEFIRRV
ncbi:MAG: ParA family protein [Candidatus Njordarchaeia archaeon]